MTDTAILVVGLSSIVVAIALAVAAVASANSGPTGVAKSLAAIEAMGKRVGAAPADEPFEDRVLRPALATFAGLARRLTPTGQLVRIGRLLDLAGNPPAWTSDRVLAFKGLGLIGVGGLGAMLGARNVVLLVLFAAVGGAAGLYIPDLLVYNAGIKRQEKIQKSLPDALDMLTVCVEAGLGFDAALSQVARNTDGPLAGEFFRVLKEMQIGRSRGQAFEGMAERTTVVELRVFVSALAQADALGIPIARVLREQAKEMRLKRRQRAEERAQKVPVKILMPLIFCIFPALFIVVIGPGALGIIKAFSGV